MAKKSQPDLPLQHRNDAIKDALKGLVPELEGSHLRVDFYCECSRSDCIRRIGLLVSEYEHAHRDPAQHTVKPGHVMPLEQIAERHDHYWVIKRAG